MSARHHNAPPLAERLALDHEGLKAKVAGILADGDLAPIMADDDLAAWAARAAALKGAVALVEKARKTEKDQVLKDGRAIDGFFADIAAPIKEAADAVVGAINDWQSAKLAAQRAAERQAAMPAAKVADIGRVVATETGRVAVSAATFWTFEVTNRDQVPAAYLMPNEAAIKAAIAGGVREIPGVRVYEDVRTIVR